MAGDEVVQVEEKMLTWDLNDEDDDDDDDDDMTKTSKQEQEGLKTYDMRLHNGCGIIVCGKLAVSTYI